MLVFARVLFAAGAGWLFDLYFRKPRRYVYLALRGLRLPAPFFMGCAFLPRYIAVSLCCGK